MGLIMTMRVTVGFLFILTITSFQFQHLRSEQFPASLRTGAGEDKKTSKFQDPLYSETAGRRNIISSASVSSDGGRRALVGFRAGGTTAASVASRSNSGCGPSTVASTLLVSSVLAFSVVPMVVIL